MKKLNQFSISRRGLLVGSVGAGALAVMGPRAFAAPAKVDFGVGGIDSIFILAYVADKLGTFTKSGISVELVNTQSGPRTKQLLAAQQVFAGMAAAGDPITVTLAGKEATLVAGCDRKITYANVLVHKDNYDKGMRSLTDLGGQLFGVTQPQSGSWLVARYLLERVGLKDKADVRALGDLTTMLGGLKSKQVGATMATMGMVEQAVREGWGVPILDVTDEDAWMHYFGGDVPGVGVYMMRKTVQERPEDVQAFVSGITAAQDFLNASTPEEITEVVHADYLSAFSKESLNASFATYKKSIWLKDNIISRDAFDRLAGIMGGGRQFSDAEMAKAPYEVSVDMRFVQKAREA